ncbi:MAG: hypothetical protein IPP25_08555 [Saprospiraceae bacterium]|nr:hypothetical protein [Candidatus Opimibacter skivensis]
MQFIIRRSAPEPMLYIAAPVDAAELYSTTTSLISALPRECMPAPLSLLLIDPLACPSLMVSLSR